MRDTLGEREIDKFVESPSRPNKTAVEVVVSGDANGLLTTQKIAITIDSGNVNTWVDVETVNMKNIVTIETFDELDTSKIDVEWRIVGGILAQVKSKNLLTITVHVIGYT